MEKKELLKKILLFVMGYCLYIAIEVTYRGMSYRLMGLVGGFILAFVCDPLNDRISWNIPLLFQMFLCSVIITILELLSGEFALRILNVRMWDYRNLWGNCFDGLICPIFSFVWFLLSGIGIVICDAFNYYVLHDNVQPYYRIGRKIIYLPVRNCISEK